MTVTAQVDQQADVKKICEATYNELILRNTKPDSFSQDGIPQYNNAEVQKRLLEEAKSVILQRAHEGKLTLKDGNGQKLTYDQACHPSSDSLITQHAQPLVANAKNEFQAYVNQRTLEKIKNELDSLTDTMKLNEASNRKYQLLHSVACAIKKQDDPKDFRMSMINFIVLALQRNKLSHKSSTTAANNIMNFFNNSRNKHLKNCLFLGKQNTPVTYQDLLDLTETKTESHSYYQKTNRFSIFSQNMTSLTLANLSKVTL